MTRNSNYNCGCSLLYLIGLIPALLMYGCLERCYEEHEHESRIWKEGDPLDCNAITIAPNYAIIEVSNVSRGEEVGIAFGDNSDIEYPFSHIEAPYGSTSFTITLDGLKPGKTYYYCTYSRPRKLGPLSEIKFGKSRNFTTKSRSASVKQAIDLGLSVKWASCNIGAESPEDYGAFYQFGESYEKDNYDAHPSSMSHARLVEIYKEEGWNFPRRIWGDGWRSPTWKEFVELKSKCKWEWTQINGINGYKITGKNGAYIFLPAAGSQHGKRVSARNIGGIYPLLDETHSIGFTSIEVEDAGRLSTGSGYVVRAVCK